ncbi:MAG: carboxylating nicotinate-nucleotide diphosphorylase [Bacillota bacterium]
MTLNQIQVQQIIDRALEEDIGSGDITTKSVMTTDQELTGKIEAKAEGVVAGLEVAELVYQRVDRSLNFEYDLQDGSLVQPEELLATVSGSAASILTGERVMLNFLQRMSGIATKANYYRQLISDYDVRIVDTRKTTPGLRILEKYAVRVGGGANHRFGLYDAVMIKDNHITAVGGIKAAVKTARRKIPHTMKIEVETETLADVKAALAAKADIIMLDNMSPELMTEAVELIGEQAVVEASGGITKQEIEEVAQTGVDVISLGTLTHTIDSLDISLNF